MVVGLTKVYLQGVKPTTVSVFSFYVTLKADKYVVLPLMRICNQQKRYLNQ